MGCKGSKGGPSLDQTIRRKGDTKKDAKDDKDPVELDICCVVDESPPVSTALGWRWMSGSLLFCAVQHFLIKTNGTSSLSSGNETLSTDASAKSRYLFESSSAVFVDTRPLTSSQTSAISAADLMTLDHEKLKRRVALKSVGLADLFCPKIVVHVPKWLFIMSQIHSV